MTYERFFKGFFAALRFFGMQLMFPGTGSHYIKFSAVIHILGKLPDEWRTRFPLFVRNPGTGRFDELNAALLKMDGSYLTLEGPSAKINLTFELARQVLGQFPDMERRILRMCAVAYLEGSTDDVFPDVFPDVIALSSDHGQATTTTDRS